MNNKSQVLWLSLFKVNKQKRKILVMIILRGLIRWSYGLCVGHLSVRSGIIFLS